MSEQVQINIDGQDIEVAKGTLLIRAAEKLGIHIPRFCDHPLLDPAGACRQCLVEVAMPGRDGVVRPMPKPQPACTMTAMAGMEIKTAATSEVAEKAQHGITEFLLINHPLDCPICDKGGECPLQNQAMSHGTLHTRFSDEKRLWPKPVELTSQILIDRERCVLCQRCVRFANQIAGDSFIALQGRGGGSSPRDDHDFMGENVGAFDQEILGISDSDGSQPSLRLNPEAAALSDSHGKPAPLSSPAAIGAGVDEKDQSGRLFSSYFSGNIIQICPVGALTSKRYRFRARPFDLVSTRGVTEQDASGSALRTDIRRGVVTRRMAQQDLEVNEEWITDKDRFGYQWQFQPSRIKTPLVREDGKLVPTSWSDAFDRAAKGLAAAGKGKVGFLPGGRLTFEDAYTWSKFARVVCGTNDIDQRTRAAGREEETFLGAYFAGAGMPVTYSDLEKAGQVLLVGFEPEDECGAVFLRLRKGVRSGNVKVATVAPFASPSSVKTAATVLFAAPGTEPEVVANVKAESEGDFGTVFAGLQGEGAVIVVGERAGTVPGLLAAVNDLAARSGARLAWIPRRSGERGGVEAGALPGLLPFGRDARDAEARSDLAAAWNAQLPDAPGRDTHKILEGACSGELSALVLGGLDLRDLPDQELAQKALAAASFVVSLEVNLTPAAQAADVVFPVAPVSEKPGTLINWEGRLRPFGQALVSQDMPDWEVLGKLAQVMGVELGIDSLKSLYAEANELLDWDGQRVAFEGATPAELVTPPSKHVVLTCHKTQIDEGLFFFFSTDMQAAGRASFARISPETAQEFGISAGSAIKLKTDSGQIQLPVVLTKMPQRVVWVPECSARSHVHESLGVTSGALVQLEHNAEVQQ
ncbi:NADH-quinone oxidoreductase subunit G [Varibaculum cambriense]|uniref:NADH-quinone oxidoreductase subunit G n=1 Tax=Varibaculum cambriense TaxID=184870 RepID=UPI0029062726|nr:NADH-quinone oxidoreductase subunit G [Varibaculum cambriense]MDU3274813.1 NADH-quinone oxidoreductase subunit G [Varibaculum cambriense]